ncbi:DsbA family protein [Geothrix oryzisoli]|uniref:DsbA family protein n=1 Tax=Geothrix oryzisoli TaxID=2922721 RepID=UPI001FADB644|nr:thioredoxin domain-containing protein [Geothrix oryzisoli]
MIFPRCAARLVFLATLAVPVCMAQQAAGPSLQRQIDDLKDGQRRMLEELEAIKGLLKERTATGGPALPKAGSPLSVNVFREPFKGASGARVAILEYSDFDCPYCARYATQVFPRLDADYVRTGKVKYFFRDLPLPVHPDAQFKARIARCAGEQGKFWEAHDRLFADQRPFDPAALAKLVRDLGLDAAAFNASLEGGKYAENIRLSVASAERMQIQGAPAFLFGTLNAEGQVLSVTKVVLGAESYESFKETLDALLASSASTPAPEAIRVASASACE